MVPPAAAGAKAQVEADWKTANRARLREEATLVKQTDHWEFYQPAHWEAQFIATVDDTATLFTYACRKGTQDVYGPTVPVQFCTQDGGKWRGGHVICTGCAEGART